MDDGSMNPLESQGFPIKLDALAPFPYYWDTVLISIDIEAWERDQSYITEVGVAMLDTRKIAGIPPGRNGENWVKKIRARHLRINENLKLVNSAFVQGNPDMFQFGKSEFLSKLEVREALFDILNTPDDEPDTDYDDDDVVLRNFAIIGHNVECDTSILKKQFNIWVWMSHWCMGVVDTQKMWCSFHNGPGGNRGLGNILTELKIDHQFLHNAGNDAMYTLQAFIAIALLEGVSAEESLKSAPDSMKVSANGASARSTMPEIHELLLQPTT
jgi:hypothetical protein